MYIDLRSDTVTKPSKEMLSFMAVCSAHSLGDDVAGEDPTVNALEQKLAEKFKMEAALFCPSGTMTNQIAIKLHTQPGDEVILDYKSHTNSFEVGGIAFHSLASVKPIQTQYGILSAKMVKNAINSDDIHKPPSTLVVLENTHNRGGGSCYKQEEIEAIRTVCLDAKLKMHLDGARIFNAIVANNEDPVFYGAHFDTISVCLSKGLGAPVGSVLLGSQPIIKKARKLRKLFGGGMRQAGVIASGGLYAIENNIQRLADDHAKAKEIAQLLESKSFVTEIYPVETNIIIFSIAPNYMSGKDFGALLKEKNILAYEIAPQQFRFVFHLDITSQLQQELFNKLKSL
ncbi:MAG: beta-eliminating lyase-related protein [Sediminibacterium sp.]|nr:beta-eliminating lyase-related protein [Sediminibacterium sp.]